MMPALALFVTERLVRLSGVDIAIVVFYFALVLTALVIGAEPELRAALLAAAGLGAHRCLHSHRPSCTRRPAMLIE